jgi:threonine dehydrogenase-like Zn-dependent dehydrogenase
MTLAEFPAAISVKRKFAAAPVRAAQSRADCEVAVIGAGPYGLAARASAPPESDACSAKP